MFIEEETCTEIAPSKIWFDAGYLSGIRFAYCRNCDFKSVYWECACDLEHDCNEEE